MLPKQELGNEENEENVIFAVGRISNRKGDNLRVESLRLGVRLFISPQVAKTAKV